MYNYETLRASHFNTTKPSSSTTILSHLDLQTEPQTLDTYNFPFKNRFPLIFTLQPLACLRSWHRFS